MKARKAALVFILITVSLDMIALGIIIPVLPKLILNFLGGSTARAATWVGIFGTVFALMQFVFSPVLGVVSDRVGRRPVILLSNVGLGLDYIVMALAPTIGWLFLGRIISGITAASITTAMAYISDVVVPEKRAGAFGLIGAAFGLGFIIGPALGGWLGAVDPRLPFWVAGGLSLVNAAYGFLVLPESLGTEKRRAFSFRRANPVGSLVLLRSHPELSRLAVIQFISYTAHEVVQVYVLYVIYRYLWNEKTIGLSLAFVGICTVIISGGMVRPVVARLGERRALYLGQALGAIGMLLMGWGTTAFIFMIGVTVMNLWSLAGPAAQGMMTHRVGASEQGELQGAISSLRAIAMLIGPGLFSFTFAWSINPAHGWKIPGVPWYLAAAMLFLAMLLAFTVEQPAMTPAAAPAE
ncbi:MAG TPA: TCR/Tet family MFS transporter [Chthoniobacterales bacterium]|jgi:DHA1 family tetracycline resistance protein-like MFS transporter